MLTRRTLLAVLACFSMLPTLHAADTWQAGVAREVITPPEFVWMSGYGNREKPAEGIIHDLFVRVACLQAAGGEKAIFISTDLVGVPVKMSTLLSKEFEQKYGVPRANVMFTCSHTHCGPALDEKLTHMLAMNEDDWKQTRKYQEWLNDRVRAAVDTAVKDLSEARVSYGKATCGFASNRRAPRGIGPVDHDVPVLKITDPAGKVRGVVFGYACHNTTLGIYEWCGDYAGFAQLNVEDNYPGAVAMFFTGCGADQNPMPRRTVELCEMYGRVLSVAVQEVVNGSTTELKPTLQTGFRHIDLDFAFAPTAEEVQEKLKNGNRYQQNWARSMQAELDAGGIQTKYPYPVQVWKLGDQLTWVALGGEVVVDYSLRLKRELGETTTWVTGYANDVMAYIPSERVLTEGGYEGANAMLYYQKPSPWKPGLEAQIIDTVHDLAPAKSE